METAIMLGDAGEYIHGEAIKIITGANINLGSGKREPNEALTPPTK